jgi:hypothetical protein
MSPSWRLLRVPVLLVPSAWGQVGVIAIAGMAGLFLFKPAQAAEHDPLPTTVSHRAGAIWLSLFFALLVGLPVLQELRPNHVVAMVDGGFAIGISGGFQLEAVAVLGCSTQATAEQAHLNLTKPSFIAHSHLPAILL